MIRVILVIFLLTQLTSCFEDTKTGVSIDLGTLDASIQNIHVLVMAEDKIVSLKTFDRYVQKDRTLYVPSNEELDFVILGENSSNLIGFYGKKTTTITGEKITVSISVTDISNTLNPEYEWVNPYFEIRWNKVTGAESYSVYDENWGSWIELYNGQENILQTTINANYTYYVDVFFESIGLRSTGEAALNVGV